MAVRAHRGSVVRRYNGTVAPHLDWTQLLEEERSKPYWRSLQTFVAQERKLGPVYPAESQVLAALQHTPRTTVRVMVLGQDPYHGPRQAHGLAFSIQPPNPPPPSLRNIFIELQSDTGCEPPVSGSLLPWAQQGVLLLNTVLTVRGGQANSHRGRGWEAFTDAVFDSVNALPDRVVFLLWGAAARKKLPRIDAARHAVITSAHPSPLSASRGFFGSSPFSRTNQLLREAGRKPINWELDGSQG
ncbi:MAG: uracil-DNA glycosylase [Acidimicrobiales bacterium]|nr:uracil-DNA glycosylase [Acidimicrobiales bacterium]